MSCASMTSNLRIGLRGLNKYYRHNSPIIQRPSAIADASAEQSITDTIAPLFNNLNCNADALIQKVRKFCLVLVAIYKTNYHFRRTVVRTKSLDHSSKFHKVSFKNSFSDLSSCHTRIVAQEFTVVYWCSEISFVLMKILVSRGTRIQW